jgi:hypothetical protein
VKLKDVLRKITPSMARMTVMCEMLEEGIDSDELAMMDVLGNGQGL